MNKKIGSIGLLTYVPVNLLSDSLLLKIKDDLTYIEKDAITREVKVIEYYYMLPPKNSIIAIPRFYVEKNLKDKIPVEIDKYNKGDLSFKIINNSMPRDPAQLESVNFLKSNRFAVLKAKPGFGKTWVAIKAISDLNKKALIIVDTLKLGKQWMDAITQFTNIKEEEIGFISGKESIQKELDNKKIVIALIQTLSSLAKNMDKDAYKRIDEANFGITVIDEVHATIGSEHFTKASIYFMSEYIWALSATPKKQTKRLTKILYYFISDNLFEPVVESKISVKVIPVFFNSELGRGSLKYIRWGGYLNRMRYYKQLIKYSKPYRELFRGLFQNLVIKADKSVIFIAHLIDILKEFINIATNELNFSPDDIGLLIQGSDLHKDINKKVIFTTYKMMTKGLSPNHVDCLVMLTPVSAYGTTLEQVTGRITRDHTKSTVKYIVDIIDTHPTLPELMRMFNTNRYNRVIAYKEFGFDVGESLYFNK